MIRVIVSPAVSRFVFFLRTFSDQLWIKLYIKAVLMSWPSQCSCSTQTPPASSCWTPSAWRRGWGRGRCRRIQGRRSSAGRAASSQTKAKTERSRLKVSSFMYFLLTSKGRVQSVEFSILHKSWFISNELTHCCMRRNVEAVLHQDVCPSKHPVHAQVHGELKDRYQER